MAKLPYTYTICPPGPEPQRFTASCAEMGRLLKDSPKGDLTIDERRDLWSAYNRAPRSVTIEDWLVQNFGVEKK